MRFKHSLSTFLILSTLFVVPSAFAQDQLYSTDSDAYIEDYYASIKTKRSDECLANFGSCQDAISYYENSTLIVKGNEVSDFTRFDMRENAPHCPGQEVFIYTRYDKETGRKVVRSNCEAFKKKEHFSPGEYNTLAKYIGQRDYTDVSDDMSLEYSSSQNAKVRDRLHVKNHSFPQIVKVPVYAFTGFSDNPRIECSDITVNHHVAQDGENGYCNVYIHVNSATTEITPKVLKEGQHIIQWGQPEVVHNAM